MAAREPAEAHAPSGLQGLVLAALGIVYGDIGTSPLYTIRETLRRGGGLRSSRANVLGVLSLIFWSLIVDRHASSTSCSSCGPTIAARAACWR